MATSAPIDMSELQNAIHRWFSESTDLTTIWEQQSSPRPEYPYASLNIISGPTSVAQRWDVSHEYDAVNDELDFNAGIPCMFTVSAKVFVNRPAGINPLTDSKQYLLRAEAELQNEDRITLLQSKTISFVRKEALDDIGSIRNDGFVKMAGMDFVFGSVMNSQWYASFIERVHVSSNLTKDFYIDINETLIVVDQLGGNTVIDSVGNVVVT